LKQSTFFWLSLTNWKKCTNKLMTLCQLVEGFLSVGVEQLEGFRSCLKLFGGRK
jgi:hypothetical protein